MYYLKVCKKFLKYEIISYEYKILLTAKMHVKNMQAGNDNSQSIEITNINDSNNVLSENDIKKEENSDEDMENEIISEFKIIHKQKCF